MNKLPRKYFIYLIISSIILIGWLFLSLQKAPLLNNKIMLLLGAFFIFNFIVIFLIYTGIGNLTDIDIKDAKEIWWTRVVTLTLLSIIISYSIVFRNNRIDNIVRTIINSAAFGILLGYWIKKLEEKSKLNEDGEQFIRNLQVEVSTNRFNCQAMLKDWQPLFLQSFVWDNLKLTKHFQLLWQEKDLINKLTNLYLSISSANFMANQAQLASHNIIHAPDATRVDIAKKTQDSLKNVLSKEVLPKLSDMEKELEDFVKAIYRKRMKSHF